MSLIWPSSKQFYFYCNYYKFIKLPYLLACLRRYWRILALLYSENHFNNQTSEYWFWEIGWVLNFSVIYAINFFFFLFSYEYIQLYFSFSKMRNLNYIVMLHMKNWTPFLDGIFHLTFLRIFKLFSPRNVTFIIVLV